jgi:glutathione peroxidase
LHHPHPLPHPLTRRRLVALMLTPLALLGPCAALATTACPAVLNHTLPRLQDEKPMNLCEHAGKVVLVVNTASFCGFTGQYKGLEALYAQYRERGLVVLGFPSNDFSQETGSNKDIAAFCESTYGVKFPMFVKSSVAPGAGRQVNPVFAGLAQRTGQAPKWNFHKYLISRQGDAVTSFGTSTDPKDPAFLKELEKLLKAN